MVSSLSEVKKNTRKPLVLAAESVCTGGISKHLKVKGYPKICGLGERKFDVSLDTARPKKRKERKLETVTLETSQTSSAPHSAALLSTIFVVRDKNSRACQK